MTALNPVMTIGAQFDEHLARIGVACSAAERARCELLDAVHLRDERRCCAAIRINSPAACASAC